MDSTFTTALRASGPLKLTVAEAFARTAELIEDACVRSLVSGGKLMLCGNGGSASDFQHDQVKELLSSAQLQESTLGQILPPI